MTVVTTVNSRPTKGSKVVVIVESGLWRPKVLWHVRQFPILTFITELHRWVLSLVHTQDHDQGRDLVKVECQRTIEEYKQSPKLFYLPEKVPVLTYEGHTPTLSDFQRVNWKGTQPFSEGRRTVRAGSSDGEKEEKGTKTTKDSEKTTSSHKKEPIT